MLALTASCFALSSGCANNADEKPPIESMITQESHDLVMIQSKNGMKKYLFDTPLMEFYEYAAEPYREFREGIYVETYQDSTNVVESAIRSDYALYYTDQDLWFASGNVIAESRTNERTLYTEQLFWNQRTGRVYSYVDCVVVDKDNLANKSKGLESDDQLTDMVFFSFDGQIPIESAPNERAERPSARDSIVNAPPGPSSLPSNAPSVRDGGKQMQANPRQPAGAVPARLREGNTPGGANPPNYNPGTVTEGRIERTREGNQPVFERREVIERTEERE